MRTKRKRWQEWMNRENKSRKEHKKMEVLSSQGNQQKVKEYIC